MELSQSVDQSSFSYTMSTFKVQEVCAISRDKLSDVAIHATIISYFHNILPNMAARTNYMDVSHMQVLCKEQPNSSTVHNGSSEHDSIDVHNTLLDGGIDYTISL